MWYQWKDTRKRPSDCLSSQCFEDDVVLTLKCLVRHLPIPETDAESSRFVFMQCINGLKGHVWYNKKHRVSAKVLGGWMKYMLKGIGVEGNFTGKLGRSSVVSRLARANVPIDVGMNVTGHRNPESYKRYDKTTEIKTKAAMSIIGQPFKSDGSRRMFNDVYFDELKAFDASQVSGSFNVVPAPSNSVNLNIADDTKPEQFENKGNDFVTKDVVGVEKEVVGVEKEVVGVGKNVGAAGSELDDSFFDTVSFEDIAGDNPRLRKAFNLNFDAGSNRITGGTFNNCIILSGGSSTLDVCEIVKRIIGGGSL